MAVEPLPSAHPKGPTYSSTSFDPSQAYELHPEVALRPEPFGALAYHHGTRRLTFLRSRDLVDLVAALGAHGSAASAMAAVGIGAARRRLLEAALASLAASGVIRAR